MHTTKDILGVRFDFVDYQDVCEKISGWRTAKEPHFICLSNADTVMMARRDPAMRQATNNASLVLPDGIGIVAAATLSSCAHRGRVTGPSLLLKLCDWGREHGFRHFFLGGAPGVPQELARRICALYPGVDVVGSYSPPFRPLTNDEDRALIDRINEAQPDILWVGLGAPKQEIWMAEHVRRIDVPAMIGVGAAFDFHSGKVSWAPAWVRSCGMEWAYRFMQRPQRLWRRTLDKLCFPLVFGADRVHNLLTGVGSSRFSLEGDPNLRNDEKERPRRTFNKNQTEKRRATTGGASRFDE